MKKGGFFGQEPPSTSKPGIKFQSKNQNQRDSSIQERPKTSAEVMKPTTSYVQARTQKKEVISKMQTPSDPNKMEKLGDGVPSISAMQLKYLNKNDQLAEDHEKLIEQILEDEEQLIFKHNASCKEGI